MLQDKFGRVIDYLRIAVTDRCNFKCEYCMPAEGIKYDSQTNLLNYEEIIRLVKLLSKEGINKIRITGGEPFLRKDLMVLLRALSEINLIDKIAITTNGTLTSQYIDELLELGIKSINLSIDSLDKSRFNKITRTNQFENVWNCFEKLLKKDFDLKINCVILDGQNIDDIIPMIKLGEKYNISVRFIEEMPFNGSGTYHNVLKWDYNNIIGHIKNNLKNIVALNNEPGSTSINFRVHGYIGRFGIIPAYTRSFCGSCNRLRLTPNGVIKTCLYDEGIFNVRDLIRAGASEAQLLTAISEAIHNKAENGFEAERGRLSNKQIIESMAIIGG